jgi:cytoskeletal protein CcmA (bactofilin family)
MFSKPSKPNSFQPTPSIIGANCSLAGDIVSDGEVHVDGKVVGDVRCVTLVIGEGGGVTGEINAETVRVLGAVTGQITARAVELAKTARILGDITHDSLAVEAGAYVEGRFNRLQPGQPIAKDGIPTSALVKAAPAKTEADRDEDDQQPANVIMLGN